MSRRLVVMPSQWDNSGFYRIVFAARELAAAGWSVEAAPHVMQRLSGIESRSHYGIYRQVEPGRLRLEKDITGWLLERQFDVLVMGCRTEPYWAELIPALRAQGKQVVVDSDDAWLGLPDWNPASRRPDGDVLAMLSQIGSADRMTVATPALAEMYRPYQPNISVVRNRLDWRMWIDAPMPWQLERRRPRVGWMGWTSHRAGDLGVIRNVVTPWLLKNPGWDFVAAGDPKTHDVLAIPKDRRVTTGIVAFANRDLQDITAVMDIGLVPLKLNDPKARSLNECKSHLKGMEYAACGVPCIASPTESYRWWLEQEAPGTGFLAGKVDHWLKALDALRDETLRRRMGEAARAAAERATVQEHFGDWGAVYENCGPDRHTARTLEPPR